MDLAASIQAVTEEAVLRIGRHVRARTGLNQLVLAGGVALNCVANGRLLREGEFDDLWIQPAAGDAGGALGAALFVWYQLLDKPRQLRGPRLLSRGASWAQALRPSRLLVSYPRKAHLGSTSLTKPNCLTMSLDFWPTARSLAGSRAGWSSAPGPWAHAAFWAIPAHRPCKPP